MDHRWLTPSVIHEGDGYHPIWAAVELRLEVDEDVEDNAEEDEDSLLHSDRFSFKHKKTALKGSETEKICPFDRDEDGDPSDDLNDPNAFDCRQLPVK